MVETIYEQTRLWEELSNKSTNYLCKIPDKPAQPHVSSQTPQQTSSATNMRAFEHLKPERLLQDELPEDVDIYKEACRVWFQQVCRPNGVDADQGFVKSSIFATVDKSWQMVLNTNPNINNATMEEIFKMIDRKMLVTKPISVLNMLTYLPPLEFLMKSKAQLQLQLQLSWKLRLTLFSL